MVETIFHWYLQGNRIIPMGFLGARSGLRPSTVGKNLPGFPQRQAKSKALRR